MKGKKRKKKRISGYREGWGYGYQKGGVGLSKRGVRAAVPYKK